MDFQYNPRILSSILKQKMIAKENEDITLGKKFETIVNKRYDTLKSTIEKEIQFEEQKCKSLEETKNIVQRHKMHRELKSQIESKEVEKDVEKAEALILSLALKAEDEESRQQLLKKKSNENNTERLKELQEFAATQMNFKHCEELKREAADNVRQITEEQQDSVSTFKRNIRSLKEEQKKCQSMLEQIQMGVRLYGEYEGKRERETVRKEYEEMMEEKKEAERRRKEEEKIKRNRSHLFQEQQKQIRTKEEMKEIEREKEEEYLQLVSKLLVAEEECLAMEATTRRDRERRQRAVAEEILEERRRRRKGLVDERKGEDREDAEVLRLRTSILEEEERRLMLKHVPHVHSLRAPHILAKLAQMG